jgi:hypothetical protein
MKPSRQQLLAQAHGSLLAAHHQRDDGAAGGDLQPGGQVLREGCHMLPPPGLPGVNSSHRCRAK